jgi:hypothetical protein
MSAANADESVRSHGTVAVVVASVRHQMNTDTAVKVFLGNPITIASEIQFLARLRHDLLRLGVSARILANLQAGREDRQIDFVVITEGRVVQIEEKTFPGRIVEGPTNGPWSLQHPDQVRSLSRHDSVFVAT